MNNWEENNQERSSDATDSQEALRREPLRAFKVQAVQS
jgi:hypothetical protein